MPTQYENTGEIFTLVETDNVNKVPFIKGQYIIVDDGMVYYDPTTGDNINNRICLTPKREVDVNDRAKDSNDAWLSDQYYLDLCTNPIDGDINIIRTPINGTDKKEYTIYTYNDGHWIKETGSYNAKNVFLDDDISLTIPFGNKELVNGYSKFDTTGLSVYDALNTIFAPELEPEVIQPSMELSITPDKEFIEYGTSIQFNSSILFDSGKYEFGPATSVVAKKYTLRDSTGLTFSEKSGTFNVSNITKDYFIEGSVEYTGGVVPNGNKPGVQIDSKKIQPGLISIKKSYKVLSADLICGTFTSAKDKITKADLNECKKAYLNDADSTTFKLTIPVGTSEIYLFIPDDVSIDSVLNKNTNYDMFNAFANEAQSNLKYYNNDITYNAYVYKPANKFTAQAKLDISIRRDSE